MEVTSFISELEFGLFTTVSVIFHYYVYSLVALLSLITVPYLRKRGRYYALAFSMVAIIILVLALKGIYAVPRPCNDWLENPKVECPPVDDYGLPSGHTAFSFVFVGASLGTPVFPLYLLIGIIVGLSRMYIGVHSLVDVAGGAALGVITYLIIEEGVDRISKKGRKHGK